MRDLHANLAEQGVDVRAVPLVIQYNKQDLPREMIADAPALEDALNFRGVPSFAAGAVHGVGVFETLRAVSQLVLARLGSGAAAGRR
jgi:signal recognition particle receptor subunit beta